MSGEVSKSSGEYGELVVKKILNIIGYPNIRGKFNANCIQKEKHSHKEGKLRDTHGVDIYVQYDDPLFDDTQKNLLISVKNRKKFQSGSFKEFFKDLAYDLECVKFSKEAQGKVRNGVKKVEHYGVIFWLTYEESTDFDVMDKLPEIRNTNDMVYEAIFLVDNLRANFLLGSVEYAQKLALDRDYEFVYQQTSYNLTSMNLRKTQGKVLPVQFFNSSVLPIKIKYDKEGQYSLILTTIDPFSSRSLKRIISLAQNLTNGWANKIILAFLDYHYLKHQKDVDEVVASLNDQNFASLIKVESFSLGNYDTLAGE